MTKPRTTKAQTKRFRRNALVALLDRGLSVTALAARIRRPRSTVSRAIHGGRFPAVRDEIARALSL
jgi:IS30 family transposase